MPVPLRNVWGADYWAFSLNLLGSFRLEPCAEPISRASATSNARSNHLDYFPRAASKTILACPTSRAGVLRPLDQRRSVLRSSWLSVSEARKASRACNDQPNDDAPVLNAIGEHRRPFRLRHRVLPECANRRDCRRERAKIGAPSRRAFHWGE